MAANPIVARCSLGLVDIAQMARISDERRDKVKVAGFEIMGFLVEAEKAAKPLIDGIRAIRKFKYEWSPASV